MKLILVPWLFLGVLFPFSSAKSSSLVLTDSAKQSVLGYLYFLEDETGTLSLQDAMESDQWALVDTGVFNKGYSASSWWFRLELRNESFEKQTKYLEVSYPKLNRLEAFIVPSSSTSVHKSYLFGNKVSFSERTIKHRFFIIPIDWHAEETLAVYMKVDSSSSIQVPIVLWEFEDFHRVDNIRTIVHGFYFGGMIVIVLFNFLIFLSLREKTYFYYVCYVTAMGMFVACMNGFAFQWIWPEFIAVDDKFTIIFLMSIVLFGAEFSRHFLNLAELKLGMDYLARGVSVTAIVLIILSLILPYSSAIKLAIYLTVLAIGYAYCCGTYAWYRGHGPAKYYIVAWSSLLAGGVVLALNKFNILPKTFITDYSTQLGSAIEIVLLSFALAQRISSERNLRYQAQELALASQKKANEELELKVQERTRLIEEANERLKNISNTDQLTGLKNRRYMDAVFGKELSRCKRHSHELSVLLIDVDYFKRINDGYGHQVGDECLIHTAQQLEKNLRRPIDLVSRYGGEEFFVLLPETSQEGALVVAEQMRLGLANAPFDVGNDKKETINISVGLYSKMPLEVDDMNDFFRKADAALYVAKSNGRNCVVMASDDLGFIDSSGKKIICKESA